MRKKIEEEDMGIVRKLESIRASFRDFVESEEGMYQGLNIEAKREKEIPDIEIFLEQEEGNLENVKSQMEVVDEQIREAGQNDEIRKVLKEEDLDPDKIEAGVKAISRIEEEIIEFKQKLENSDRDPEPLLEEFFHNIDGQISKVESLVSPSR